jgi:sec-independent protein translocase protein TatB
VLVPGIIVIDMPSFSDSIFLFVLALLLFGPKKLPVLARELGKWVGEFRRASNEFKMQMEEELRLAEQEDRQKQIAAMEAAAPVAQPVDTPPHPHLPEPEPESVETPAAVAAAEDTTSEPAPEALPIATA